MVFARIRLLSSILALFLLLQLAASESHGQFSPSPGVPQPSPGGGYRPPSRPSSPSPTRPSPYSRPQRPSPYRSQPNTRPHSQNIPSVPNNRGTTYQPNRSRQNLPPAPVRLGSPGTTWNRNTNPSAIQYSRLNVGVKPLANSQWNQAAGHFSAGRVVDGRLAVDQYLARNNSLTGWMSAVSALEQSAAPASVVKTYRTRAFEMAQSELQKSPQSPLPWTAVAKFSLEEGNTAQFRTTAQEFIQRFPGDKNANYFAGIHAIHDEDWQRAEESLLKAKALGVSDESINQLLKMVIDKQRWVWQFAQITGVVIALWLLGLAFLFLAGKVMSNAVVRSIKRFGMAPGRGGLFRSCYRFLINTAGIYYFVSLPVLVLIALALPLSIGYALLLLPTISLVLIVVVLIVGAGGVLTAISGLRACFVRLPRVATGRIVTAEEAPELWSLARQVAERVKTRPVDEIRLTPGADIYVTELGGFWDRMHDRGERVLTIGIRLLDGFDEAAFCCVLAHEYGHFVHRDTAGGDVAMRIYGAMDAFAMAIIQRGPIRWWDMSVHFLRFYHRLFRRITFGASRLQEVLADKVAASNYGPAALKEGLLHAIRKGFEFDINTNERLRNYVLSSSDARSFVSDSGIKIEMLEQVEAAIHQAFFAPSTLEDTHPSPAERCRLVENVEFDEVAVGDADGRSLYESLEPLLEELDAEIQELLQSEGARIREFSKAEIQQLSDYLRHSKDPAAYLRRAANYLEIGEYDRALADLGEIPQDSELTPEVILGRATILEATKDYGRVIKTLNVLLSKFAEARTAENYLWLGQSYAQVGKHRDASKAYSYVLDQFGDSLWALIGRGRSNLALGESSQSLVDFRKALELFPNCFEARNEIGRLTDNSNASPDEAIEAAENCERPAALDA